MAQAAAAGEEELARFLHDPSAKVIRALLGNRNLQEDDILIIAKRRNLPPDILETISRDKRWSESYPVRLALAKNPRTPLSLSLTIAQYLRLFDLEEITRNHFIPLAFRHKVDRIIIERVPTMPAGNKKTLAKKAGGAVLLSLLRDADAEVVRYCLNNPYLTEAHLFKVISRADTIAETVRMIAEHPNWASRSLIRYSLARNPLTPLTLSVQFLQAMKVMELRELYADPSVPVTIKPFIHSELRERGEGVTAPAEQVFEIDEREIAELEAEETMENWFAEKKPEEEEPTTP